MKKLSALQATMLAASVLASSIAHAATMSKTDCQGSKTRISADFKTDKGNDRTRVLEAKAVSA
jgi:hypothetical protein